MADIRLTVELTANPSVESFKAEITKMVSDLNSGIPKIKVEFDKSSVESLRAQLKQVFSEFSGTTGGTPYKSIAQEAKEAAKAVKELADAEVKLAKAKSESAKTSKSSEVTDKQRTKALNDYYSAVGKVQNALRGWTQAEKSKNDTSREAYKKLNDAVSDAEKARAAYDGSAESVKRLADATARLNSTYKETGQIIAANGDNVKSFADRFNNLTNKFGMWLSASQLVMLAVRSIRQMVQESIALDSAMTQMQIVTNASSSAMESFGERAANVAKKTASSITDVVDSATVFARLGYTMDEATKLAEYTTMLQNVGNIDVSDAQSAITSIIKAYDIGASDIESIMDKLVAVGNNFPISVSEIAAGMNNASSALAAAGNSFEQSVALLTAANTTIQDAAKSSTGLRTIAARIRNTKTELDDLGEVMTKANYEELVQMLTDAGVALTTANGEYRSTYDILSDIAAMWDKMDNMRQAALATALSGTRQQAVFYSIIEQFKEASGAMDAMANSSGALDKAFGIYLGSAQAHINQFKAAFEKLSSDFIQADFISGIVDFGRYLIEILDAIIKVTNALGGLKTVLAGILTYVGVAKTEAILKFFTNIGSKIFALHGATKAYFDMARLDGASSFRAFFTAVSGGFTEMIAQATAAQIALGSLIALVGGAAIVLNLVRKYDANKHAKYDEQYSDAIGRADVSRTAEIKEAYDAYEKLKVAQDGSISSSNSLRLASKELADALGLTGKAANKSREEIEKLAEEELRASEKAARLAVTRAEQKIVQNMDMIDSTEENAIYIWAESLGFRQAKTVEERAQILLDTYDLLIKKRDEMLDSGETEAQSFWIIDGAIKLLTDDYNDLINARATLGDILDILNGNDKNGSKEIVRDVTSVLKMLTADIPHSSGIADYVSHVRKQLEDMSSEDYNIAEWIISTGEVKRFEQLGAAIDRVKKSMAAMSAINARDSIVAMLSSEDFKEPLDSLSELSKTIDGITPDKIEELSDSSAELASVLSIDGINARFLAKIFQTEFTYGAGSGLALITEDSLRLSQALEGMERQFSKVSAAKVKYDAAMSVPEKDTGFKSMAAAFKTLNDNFVAGTTNSRAFWASAEYLFGADQLEQWGWDLQTIYDAAKQNVGVFKDAESAGMGFLERMHEMADESGNIKDKDGNILATIQKLADGTYKFDIDALNLGALADQMDMSEEAVLSCLQALSMFGDVDFYDIKEVLDAIKEIGLSSDAFKGTAVNVSSLRDRLVSLGYTETEIRKIIKNLGELDDVTLVDVNGNVADIAKSLKDLGVATEGSGGLTVSVDAVADLASQMGMTREEAESLITKLHEADGITLTDANGEVADLDSALSALDDKTFTSVTSSLDGITTSAQTASGAVVELQKQINSLTGREVTVYVNRVWTGAALERHAGGGSAHGGYALTGENGPELYTHRGSAYMAGQNGPEIVYLDRGDQVYTAGETRRILNSARQIYGSIPAFSGGTPGGASGTIGVGKWDDLFGSGSGSGSGSGGGSSGGKSSKDEDNWFQKQYKLNNHLLKMCQEDTADYLEWLAWAFPKAYDEGLLTLDEYRKYQEELFTGLQNQFKDHLSDVEHEIDMRSQFEGEDKTIISLYQQLMRDIESEIAAAREQGLDDNDQYIQELQKKYKSYSESIKDIEQETLDAAKDATDKLVDYRQKMLKQEISDEKDALKKKLSNLKEFYDKQKDMLKEARDEDKYLDEQAEKRRSVTDIQDQLAQLEYDNSAWAQKRKAELRKQLKDAQKELDDFEKDHALDQTLDFLDKSYDAQEEQINAEIEQLDNLLNDPEALYNRALADISGDTSKLYEQMLEYNRRHGTGNDADVESEYGEAYAALLKYHDLHGEWYGGVQLPNATGYTPGTGSWNTETISGYKNPTTVGKQTPDRTYGMTGGGGSSGGGSSGGGGGKSNDGNVKTDDKTVDDAKAAEKAAAKAVEDAIQATQVIAGVTEKFAKLFGGSADEAKDIKTWDEVVEEAEAEGRVIIQVPTPEEAAAAKKPNNVVEIKVPTPEEDAAAKQSVIEIKIPEPTNEDIAKSNRPVGRSSKKVGSGTAKVEIGGHASGTKNAAPGLSMVDELGPEWLFTSSSGDRYRIFSGGEKVLNANATDFLYEFANNGKSLLGAIISKVVDGGSFRKVQSLISNSDIKLGDIIINGNADKATVSEIRRAQREQLTNMLREFNRLNK